MHICIEMKSAIFVGYINLCIGESITAESLRKEQKVLSLHIFRWSKISDLSGHVFSTPQWSLLSHEVPQEEQKDKGE